MSSAALPPLSSSPARARWEFAALSLVIVLSVCTAPLFDVADVTFTGDRLLGLLAVMAIAVVTWRSGLHWTAVHTALAVFTVVQVVTSLIAAPQWPSGPKFSTVYVLGWASFALVAEWARGPGRPWRAGRLWIAIGAALGLLGSALAFAANYWQIELWGTGQAEWLRQGRDGIRLILFATKFTFDEWNLYSSFLLVAFALALWCWRPGAPAASQRGRAFLPVAAIAFGLVFGMTRAAWIGMAALVALWFWVRRPGWRPAAALAGIILPAFPAQAVAIGQTPLYWRVLKPLERGKDRNIDVRRRINEATINSWRGEPGVSRSPALAAPSADSDDDERSKQTEMRPPKRVAAAVPPAPARPQAAEPSGSAPAMPHAEHRWIRQILGGGAGSTNTLQIQLSERV